MNFIFQHYIKVFITIYNYLMSTSPDNNPLTTLKQASHHLKLLTSSVSSLSELVDPTFADPSLPALQERALAYSSALRAFDLWLSPLTPLPGDDAPQTDLYLRHLSPARSVSDATDLASQEILLQAQLARAKQRNFSQFAAHLQSETQIVEQSEILLPLFKEQPFN